MENEIQNQLVVDVLANPIPQLFDLVQVANNGLQAMNFAVKVEGASNGAYFLRDQNIHIIAIFKPEDEEDIEHDTKWVKGDKAVREVATYVLHKPIHGEEHAFKRVPPPTRIRCINFKKHGEHNWTRGSLQKFIPNQPWYDYGPAVFSLRNFLEMTVIDTVKPL